MKRIVKGEYKNGVLSGSQYVIMPNIDSGRSLI